MFLFETYLPGQARVCVFLAQQQALFIVNANSVMLREGDKLKQRRLVLVSASSSSTSRECSQSSCNRLQAPDATDAPPPTGATPTRTTACAGSASAAGTSTRAIRTRASPQPAYAPVASTTLPARTAKRAGSFITGVHSTEHARVSFFSIRADCERIRCSVCA